MCIRLQIDTISNFFFRFLGCQCFNTRAANKSVVKSFSKWKRKFFNTNCGRYSEILNRFFSKENDMLSRSSALKGQFCLPERKKKCKGQVNNLRISYTFCWENKKINILFMCYQFISGS